MDVSVTVIRVLTWVSGEPEKVGSPPVLAVVPDQIIKVTRAPQFGPTVKPVANVVPVEVDEALAGKRTFASKVSAIFYLLIVNVLLFY
jgi:hypothetical protein